MASSLWDICCTAVRDSVPLSVNLLSGLPAPLIEHLAVVLSPSQLLDLEATLNNREVTERAWRRRCESQRWCSVKQVCHRCQANTRHVISYRDLWFKSYLSRYLLEHFSTWKHHQPESHPRMFLFCGKRGETPDHFPPLSYKDFVDHTAKMALLVKDVVLRSTTLSQLTSLPPITEGLAARLVSLKMDMLKDETSIVCLKVLTELMSRGQLRSVHLINVCRHFSGWLLLCFVLSGLFHCQACQQRFSHAMASVKNVSPQSASCLSNCTETVDGGNIQHCKHFTQSANNFQSYSQNSFVNHSINSGLKQCTCKTQNDETECQSSAESRFVNCSKCDENFSDIKNGSKDADLNTVKLQHILRDCFSGEHPSYFLQSLQAFDYPGWPGSGNTCESQTTDDACHLNTSDQDNSFEDNIDSACDTSDSSGDGLYQGSGQIHANPDGTMKGDDIGEEKAETTATSSASESDYDLLNEALGVFPATERLNNLSDTEGVNSHGDGPGAGMEQPSGDDHFLVKSSIGLIQQLSTTHEKEAHQSRGLDQFSVGARWSVVSDDKVTMLQAVVSSLPAWASLTSLCLDIQAVGKGDSDGGLETLVSGIRRGTLRSVVLTFNQRDDASQMCIEHFFWKTLQVLAAPIDAGSCKSVEPMQLLKLTVPEEGVTFKTPVVTLTTSTDFVGGHCSHGETTPASHHGPHSTHGLQELCLKNFGFEGPAVFSPLGEFIKGDKALSRVSLHNCSLDQKSVDLLLTGLIDREWNTLTHLDLQGSLKQMATCHWKDLCQVVQVSPSLVFLSLAECHLSPQLVRSTEFIQAVKHHSAHRHLKLDLSFNPLGEGLWDFMSQAVSPSSSLKALYFVGTGSCEESGTATLESIIQDMSDYLPLLHACCYSYKQPVADSRHFHVRLCRIARHVHVLNHGMNEEFVAMM